jgi:hypothetical protein
MSSQPFRDAIRAEWPRLMPAVRYIDTINRSLPAKPPLPLPAVWGTLGFNTNERRPLTMGANPWMLERGTVTFLIVAKSGHGDADGAAAATAAMRAWDGWQSPSGDMWIDRAGAPEQVELEANGNWFLFAVACDYSVQERVQLP